MNSVTQAAPYVFPLMGAAAVVALVIQIFIKPVLNRFLTQGTANQNAAVRASVYVVALVVVSFSQFLHYQLNTRADVSAALSISFVVAGLAITAFHVLTSDAIPSLIGKLPLPAVSLSTPPSVATPVEPPPPRGEAVPGPANAVITAPAAPQAE